MTELEYFGNRSTKLSCYSAVLLLLRGFFVCLSLLLLMKRKTAPFSCKKASLRRERHPSWRRFRFVSWTFISSQDIEVFIYFVDLSSGYCEATEIPSAVVHFCDKNMI